MYQRIFILLKKPSPSLMNKLVFSSVQILPCFLSLKYFFKSVIVWTPYFGSCVSHFDGELTFYSKNDFID